MIAIINASPLIFLGKIGVLRLLPKLFDVCLTTCIVKEEVLKPKNVPEYLILEESFSEWLKVQEPLNHVLRKKLVLLELHEGEASVIALAKELQEKGEKNVVIIDDLAAREIARTLSLQVTGTIGIILKTLHNKLISKLEAKNSLKVLIEETSFRISAVLYIKVLKEIDQYND